jgi:predicted ATP-grasp superfamily ATP-dependent carboligase
VNSLALVLGGYVNGYEIIRELQANGIKEIMLVDTSRSLASYSRYTKYFEKITDADTLLKLLNRLSLDYKKIVLYPTNDNFLLWLHKIENQLGPNCFLPFNSSNLIKSIKKQIQYEYCEKLSIPYPKSVYFNVSANSNDLKELILPIIIKPENRNDRVGFKNIILTKTEEIEMFLNVLKLENTESGQLIASEIIPGGGENIYSYVAYRNKKGKILNEWTGKKLAQYPDDDGVFSTGTIYQDKKLSELGRKLVNGMDLTGFVQPEFKFDFRDGEYKLMEINLRSMMWHRVGFLAGVNIHFTQWLDAHNEKVTTANNENNKIFNYTYLTYEILNFLARKKYWKIFKTNLFSKKKIYFAVLDWHDPIPSILEIIKLFLRIIMFFINGGNIVKKNNILAKSIKKAKLSRGNG